MTKYSIEGSTLTGIADAIREKTGSGGEIKVEDMAGKIGEISSGGSGTAIETCTVELYPYDSNNGKYYATVFRDGVITQDTLTWTTTDAITVNDVVCGSVFYIRCIDKPSWIERSTKISYVERGGDGYECMVFLINIAADGAGYIRMVNEPT